MDKREKNKKLNKLLITSGVIAIWLLIWQLAAALVGSEFLFPSPLKVIMRLAELAATRNFRLSCLYTIGRIALGCIIGSAAGILLGFVTSFSKLLKAFFAPVLAVVKSTPVASFIILLLLWLSRTGVTVTVSALLVAPILWANVGAGIESADGRLIECADVYSLGFWKKLRYIWAPACAPSVRAGFRSATGFAWKSGISAEVIAIPANAIGTSLYRAKLGLEYTDLFAWTLAVIILSLIIEKLLFFVIDAVRRKRNGD